MSTACFSPEFRLPRRNLLQRFLRVIRGDHRQFLLIHIERLLNHVHYLLGYDDAAHGTVSLVLLHPVSDLEVTMDAVRGVSAVAEESDETAADAEGPAVALDLLLLRRPGADRRIGFVVPSDVVDVLLPARCDGEGERASVLM